MPPRSLRVRLAFGSSSPGTGNGPGRGLTADRQNSLRQTVGGIVGMLRTLTCSVRSYVHGMASAIYVNAEAPADRVPTARSPGPNHEVPANRPSRQSTTNFRFHHNVE